MSDLELAAEHFYVTEVGGTPRVSVTTVVKLLDNGKTDALMKWADRLAKEGKNHIEERNRLGDLGTRIHKHMLSWAKGEDVVALPDELGFLDAAEKWRNDSGAVSIEHEQVVVSHLGYGGCFDSIELIDGELVGCDYKTGRLHDRENELQHAAYWNADGIAVYDEAGMFTGIRELPKVTRWMSLNLHADGTYLPQPYPKRRRGQKDIPIETLQARAWTAFRHLLVLHGWLHPTNGAMR